MKSFARFALVVMAFGCLLIHAEVYDPIRLGAVNPPKTVELLVHDKSRSRDIPILVYLPEKTSAQPVIIFSHGLGGSRHGSAFMGRHWASRGYVAVFIQHPGSDESVWLGKPPGALLKAMNDAASAENFLLRVKDVPAVLDQLERWNNTESNMLKGRLDMKKIGMSGHSFGAVTAQALSGQTYGGTALYTDSRITAAVMCSPSIPKIGSVKNAFGGVTIPWMLMTGTKDSSPIGKVSPESRLEVYAALPHGGKYQLILNNAEHSVFTERALPGDRQARNPNHHRSILAMTTAFWDACLRNDPNAKQWLKSDAARSVLDKEDAWQYK